MVLRRTGSFHRLQGLLMAHINIIHPNESASNYYNRKGYYSIITQAMVDFRGLFMDVYIGWPGKVHDARVFVNSSLYHKGRNSVLFPDWKSTICGVQVSIMTFKKFTFRCRYNIEISYNNCAILLTSRYHW